MKGQLKMQMSHNPLHQQQQQQPSHYNEHDLIISDAILAVMLLSLRIYILIAHKVHSVSTFLQCTTCVYSIATYTRFMRSGLK